ncbi:hypothetical protein NQ176_g2608 [Zarea fungicola]|uniref:Uncharacterized protein n=1 Tax=Zarea fungicola TaxID=93591 RepID=A0ACC1NQ62_9HYPO|nr:hypothetical protein NQ176_g2608 [Lecanicillium fungicola]
MSHIREYSQSAPYWDQVSDKTLEQRLSHPLFPSAQYSGSSARAAHNRWLASLNSAADSPLGLRSPPNAPQQEAGNTREEGNRNSNLERRWPSFNAPFAGQHVHSGANPSGPWANAPHGQWGGQGPHAPASWTAFKPQGGFAPSANTPRHPHSFWHGGVGGPAFNHFATADKHDILTPEVDVYDTAKSFVVCMSLPGAEKEEVKVSWDQKSSELRIVGAIRRRGDEEFLKTLARDERSVGQFDRKVQLGSLTSPAQVESLSAKMENGILTIEAWKLESAYPEVKAIDIA